MRVQGRIARGSLHILDRDRTLSGIRARVRKIVRDAAAGPRPVRLVAIDYIGLLTPGDRYRGSRTNEVGEISRGIKALAMEADVPILLLSQLNREVEKRDGNRPRMSDLRDTGDIEQDADQIIFIHREDYYHATDRAWLAANPEKLDVTELLVDKNRNGQRGSVECRWQPERMRLADHSTLAFDNAA
jgi:replicative DNA helicase